MLPRLALFFRSELPLPPINVHVFALLYSLGFNHPALFIRSDE